MLIPPSTISPHTTSNKSTTPITLSPCSTDNSSASTSQANLPNPPNASQLIPDQPTHPMITRLKIGSLKPQTILNLIHKLQQPAQTTYDPSTYSEAVKHPH
ncbi:hypothetical protein KFK09_004484 [Dendrobium nobile]|uniref:Uncharacterized protein n=1 Tax=Dendrobium nobile TaxID=94219 RepID=A0A8T3C312_DENNO|nr:hypothetical protein KFK09_004484 [Dendrobium nobile]